MYLLRQIGEREAIRNAKQVAEVAGRGVVEPNLTAALVRGDPGAVTAFDRVVRQGVLGGRVVRVKIWNRDGTIVYSDEHRLIGSRYPLDAEDLRAFDSDRVEADVSDLHAPENRFERTYDKLLEVSNT